MARMAKAIDSFTQNQTRLVVIIDGLDACEQDKVLQMLDTVRPGSSRRRVAARTARGASGLRFRLLQNVAGVHVRP